MGMEEIYKSAFDTQKCITCGNLFHKRLYSEMYAGSFISDCGERVEIRRTPKEGFSDPIWIDNFQYFDGKLYKQDKSGYFSCSKKLHRVVWEKAFGKIPNDCHIHHRDEIKPNNQLYNLECLPEKEHLHYSSMRQHENGRFTWISDDARELAKAWHKSPEGKLWHVQQATKTWERKEKSCKQCWKLFDALPQQKFCCADCSKLFYKNARAIKIEETSNWIVERNCDECGWIFKNERKRGGSQKKFCSHRCWKLNYSKRKTSG